MGTRLMTGSTAVRPDPQHLLLIKRFVRCRPSTNALTPALTSWPSSSSSSSSTDSPLVRLFGMCPHLARPRTALKREQGHLLRGSCCVLDCVRL